jgi:hypothetical protein
MITSKTEILPARTLRERVLLILGYETPEWSEDDPLRATSGDFTVIARTKEGEVIRFYNSYIWQQVYLREPNFKEDFLPVWAKVVWQRKGKGGYYRLEFAQTIEVNQIPQLQNMNERRHR